MPDIYDAFRAGMTPEQRAAFDAYIGATPTTPQEQSIPIVILEEQADDQQDSTQDSTPKDEIDGQRPIKTTNDLHPMQRDSNRQPRLERIPATYVTPSDYDLSHFKDFDISRIINEAREASRPAGPTGRPVRSLYNFKTATKTDWASETSESSESNTPETQAQVRLERLRELWAGKSLLGGVGTDPPPWVVEEVISPREFDNYKVSYAQAVDFEWPYPWAPGVLHEIESAPCGNLESLFARLGAKSAARDFLVSKFPEHHTYIEPFAGSFKVLLWKKTRSKIEIVNDAAGQMINFWRYVQCYPHELVDRINSLPVSEFMFFELQKHYDRLTPFMQAVAFLYTAKLTFNGVFSSRKAGMSVYATSPFTSPKHYLDLENVLAVSERLRYVDIRSNTYVDVIERANKKLSDDGSKIVFFYMDPPYYDTKGYRQIGDTQDMPFNLGHHHRLKLLCDEIMKNGNKFMQTNSANPNILDMYKDYKREIMKVKYNVAGDEEKRVETEEVIITNY